VQAQLDKLELIEDLTKGFDIVQCAVDGSRRDSKAEQRRYSWDSSKPGFPSYTQSA
jgi:hypothetical protein